MVEANIEQPLSTELKPSHPPAVKLWHLGNPTLLLCSTVPRHINHEGFRRIRCTSQGRGTRAAINRPEIDLIQMYRWCHAKHHSAVTGDHGG